MFLTVLLQLQTKIFTNILSLGTLKARKSILFRKSNLYVKKWCKKAIVIHQLRTNGPIPLIFFICIFYCQEKVLMEKSRKSEL